MRLAILALIVGCNGTTSADADGAGDGDSDTDADADSDTDSDSDTDTDVPEDTDDTDEDTDDGCTPNTVFPADDGFADVVLDGVGGAFAGDAILVADVDGDGIDDLWVDGPEWDVIAQQTQGRVWLLYGPLGASGSLDTVADATFDGDAEPARFGKHMGVGDLDGDGIADVGLGADRYPGGGETGIVHFTYGTPIRWSGGHTATELEGSIPGTLVGELIGAGVTGIGDLDGDGDDELSFAGAGSPFGTVYVLPGSPARPSNPIDMTKLGNIHGEFQDYLCDGACLTSGDFDGDGEVDLVIGTARDELTGRVYLRYGDGTLLGDELAIDLPALEQTDIGPTFGEVVKAVGDLDGDGLPDLAVSDAFNSQATSFGGRAWVVLGSTVQWSGYASLADAAWLTIEGIATNGRVGSAMVGLGDVDCDGADDLAVSAEQLDGQQDDAGAVGVWLGLAGGTVRITNATALIEGGIGDEFFGSSLATGDLDGDGEGDLVVGADGYGALDGRVYVFLGSF